jgi:mannose-6-phosphate isomerase class I
MSRQHVRRYEPRPVYPPAGDSIVSGWPDIVASLPSGCHVVAIDGPMAMDWARLAGTVTAALASATSVRVDRIDVREHMISWDRIVERTDTGDLAADPDFVRLVTGELGDFFGALPHPSRAGGMTVVHGPGAALVDHDVLWYADRPKRYAEAALNAGTGHNLGPLAAAPPASLRRLFYIDWPLLDRHRDAIVDRIDRWIDVQDMDRPTSLDGPTLHRSLAALARQPFRTRPTFNTTSWGGHWAQRTLGHNLSAPNTALGYELIAPESGVLVGSPTGDAVEVPFQLVVSRYPEQMLGPPVHATFGTSFPIRFDYLDTVGGGNLSVHCHPREDYMREVFGWPYTQHETYYIMVGGEDHQVFLGLRDPADLDTFHELARAADEFGTPFDVERFVHTFPATPHQLFLVPAGTPHGSGQGNVVLEVSATPYLYSLRFYDWLRHDADGQHRPVHVDHAFRNLDTARHGDAVRRDLVQVPRTVRAGAGWHEDLLGSLPEMFFDVRRLTIDARSGATDDTDGRFHVLNVVDGDGIVVATAHGYQHVLNYAETIVIPGEVGAYRMTALGGGVARIVKSLVR